MQQVDEVWPHVYILKHMRVCVKYIVTEIRNSGRRLRSGDGEVVAFAHGDAALLAAVGVSQVEDFVQVGRGV